MQQAKFADAHYPHEVAVHSGTVYWTPANGVRSRPVGGTTTTSLSSVTAAQALAVEGNALYFLAGQASGPDTDAGGDDRTSKVPK